MPTYLASYVGKAQSFFCSTIQNWIDNICVLQTRFARRRRRPFTINNT